MGQTAAAARGGHARHRPHAPLPGHPHVSPAACARAESPRLAAARTRASCRAPGPTSGRGSLGMKGEGESLSIRFGVL
jgi:hypothetical protein